ncbi:hypothetical protein L1987_12449 [Smallanthus sonchifolius]|uniref:Uncharacterized protein n=1 Tax=Smallanthus sonchifolius TaxID=185202 RepID=A0ACB9JDT0_9ASTR|nr:hypothetical protein L1987_12449 [Smallanthus sonchifolius]
MLSSWKSTNPYHCSWFGVTCNAQGMVSELRLSEGLRNCSSLKKGEFLGGKLSNLIGKFSELRVLSLPFNQIRGELPIEIWGLKNLELIYIEGNSMTANLSMINLSIT